MSTTTADVNVLELERTYWEAMKRKDIDAIQRLTADGAIVVGAQGVRQIAAASIPEVFRNDAWSVRGYEIDAGSVATQRVTDDVVVIAYRVKEEVTVAGEDRSIEANDSTTWVRRDGTWRVVLHTESMVIPS